MPSDTLVTNEVKNSSGVEVEFSKLESEGRTKVYAQVGENPSLRHRLSIKHQETGEGMKMRRRSAVRFDKSHISTVDNLTVVSTSGYIVLDSPEGAITTHAEAANVLAELLSFCATTGAGTTVLFDGTGTGAAALINGSL